MPCVFYPSYGRCKANKPNATAVIISFFSIKWLTAETKQHSLYMISIYALSNVLKRKEKKRKVRWERNTTKQYNNIKGEKIDEYRRISYHDTRRLLVLGVENTIEHPFVSSQLLFSLEEKTWKTSLFSLLNRSLSA